MTIDEYINESVNFYSSKEYYEFRQEMLEFELSVIKSINESLFYSDNDDILNSIILCNESTSETSEKSTNSFSNKIANLWKIMITAIKKFFRNIKNVFTNKQEKRIESLEKEVGDLNRKIENKDYEIDFIQNEKSDLLKEILRKTEIIQDQHYKIEEMFKDHESINSKNLNEIHKLNAKISELLQNKDYTKKDIKIIFSYIEKLINNGVEINTSEIVLDFFKYIDELKNVVWGSTRSRTNLKVCFKEIYNEGGEKAIRNKISDMNVFKDKIKNARTNKKFGSVERYILNNMKIELDNSLLDNFEVMNGEHEDEYDGLKFIIQDNFELYSNYIRAVAEVSAEFKVASGEVMEFVKNYIKMRELAIGVQKGLVEIIKKHFDI